MPWVLYQMWLFVAPGLYKHERRAVAGFIISSMILFLCGIAFGYFIMLAAHAGFPDRLCRGPGEAADQHQRIFRADSDHSGGTGRDIRAAGADFHSVAVRHRDAEVSAEEFSLCDADYHRCRCDRDAHAGRNHHAGVHGADDRAVFDWRDGVVLCGAEKRVAGYSRRGGRNNVSNSQESKFWFAAAAVVTFRRSCVRAIERASVRLLQRTADACGACSESSPALPQASSRSRPRRPIRPADSMAPRRTNTSRSWSASGRAPGSDGCTVRRNTSWRNLKAYGCAGGRR